MVLVLIILSKEEKIQEVITSNSINPCVSSDKGKSESERVKALAIRNSAMAFWGKETSEDANEEGNTKLRRKSSRESGTHPLEYLKKVREKDGIEERRNYTSENS